MPETVVTPQYEQLPNGTLRQVNAPVIDYAAPYWGEEGRSTLDDQLWNCHGYINDDGVSKSEAILRHCGGTSILEIGCAPGAFLKLASDNGFAAEGVEPNPELARVVARYSGCTVHPTTFPDPSLPGPYDNIVAMDVLEHQHDPFTFVEECRELLTPGGRMVFMLPALFADGQFREQDRHPEHVWLFSEEHLRDWFGEHLILDRWIVGHEIVVVRS